MAAYLQALTEEGVKSVPAIIVFIGYLCIEFSTQTLFQHSGVL
ncbi:MAG: hypothetical protein K0S32_551, partial [Bacteroidetes bacterium]|nr:hypothetical protein [Bacteroidota bacterium]